jgi:Fe-S cluster assembly scaffold protein SufB
MTTKLLDVTDKKDSEKLLAVGMDFEEEKRAGSFLQQDNYLMLAEGFSDAFELLGVDEAFKRYPEIKKKYYGRAFREVGKEFEPGTEGGYFIRVKKGKTVELPIQACLLLKTQGFRQKVHNIVIIEEGAKANIITGCATAVGINEGFHLGISEFFVEKNAELNFTMIHSWEENISVRPVTCVLLDENATFISNYVCLNPVRDVVMYPTALIKGKNAKAYFSSLLLAHPGSMLDVGGRTILAAEGARSEITARAVSLGGTIFARGHVIAKSKNVQAHIDCNALLVSEKGVIKAIPELETELKDVQLSHEAAIGKIKKEEIEYLCTRGMSPEQAQAVILRGFMNIDLMHIPAAIKYSIDFIKDKTLAEGL